MTTTEYTRAAQLIARADALLFAAGAGMGVDSGLPDFRGDQGFWKAYPPYAKLGLGFSQLANPRWFATDPELAWGFYGHRLHLYRSTTPHPGFEILKRWAARASRGAFVFTSNIDGAFTRAGFSDDRIMEVHGAIDFAQCTTGRCGVFPATFSVTVDEETFRARAPLPKCPRCGALARPNVLMFGDSDFDSLRAEEQQARLDGWLGLLPPGARVVVVECGAGQAISTVRRLSETIVSAFGGTLVRLNPRDHQVPAGHISLPVGALEGLRAIDQAV
jgi:NAD-dependent SIR2 family protein deacetylase